MHYHCIITKVLISYIAYTTYASTDSPTVTHLGAPFPRYARLDSSVSRRRTGRSLSRATRSFPKLARGTVMSASGSDPNSVSGARRARVAVVGGGIAGLTAASHLARAGCDVVVYETGRGPGGRTSTRRGGPERPEWQWDHGAQYFSCKEPDGPFRPILEEWIAAGSSLSGLASLAS